MATSESDGPLLAVSTYAAGKIGSEAFISAFCNLYGLRGWMFRFGNVIGARMTHGVIFDFIRKLREDPEELLIRGDGNQEKNYFLVEECIDGMAYAYRNIPMTEDKPCDIFNLGTDSVTRVVEIAADRQGRDGTAGRPDPDRGHEASVGRRPAEGAHHRGPDAAATAGRTKLTSDQAVRIAVRRMLGKG